MLKTDDPKIRERYATLPQKVRSLLWSEEMGKAIFDIGKSSNLTQDQIQELADEITMMILGAAPAQDFPFNVQRKLNLTSDRTNAIIKAVNEKVFEPIRPELRAIHEPLPTPAAQKAIPPEHLAVRPLSTTTPSIFVKPVPKPPEYSAGRDPYREVVEEKITTPKPIIPTPTPKPLALLATEQDSLKKTLEAAMHQGVVVRPPEKPKEWSNQASPIKAGEVSTAAAGGPPSNLPMSQEVLVPPPATNKEIGVTPLPTALPQPKPLVEPVIEIKPEKTNAPKYVDTKDPYRELLD